MTEIGNDIHNHTIIMVDYVSLGNYNELGPFAVIGTPPEHLQALQDGWMDDAPEQHQVLIGNHNIIREFTTVHAPTGLLTVIGDHNLLMTKTHVGHDCNLESHIVMAPTAILGGHVTVMDHATFGMGAVVHQHKIIGSYTMIGMGAVITKNIRPFIMTWGASKPGKAINRIGMERNGFSQEEITAIWHYYFGNKDHVVLTPRLQAELDHYEELIQEMR